MSREKTAMIVAPHPDDAELAMGGTIVKLLGAGWALTVVDLTDGEPTPFGTRQVRAQETEASNRILGLQHRLCLDMPNRHLEATLANRTGLAEVIRRHRPTVLFAPLAPDRHPDHTATTELVDAARFEAKLHKTSLIGEPHWVPRLYHYYTTHGLRYERPSFVVDVTDAWDRKLVAIRAYASQVEGRAPGTGQSLVDHVEAVGRYFGLAIGCGYGEPFVSREPITVQNLDRFDEPA